MLEGKGHVVILVIRVLFIHRDSRCGPSYGFPGSIVSCDTCGVCVVWEVVMGVSLVELYKGGYIYTSGFARFARFTHLARFARFSSSERGFRSFRSLNHRA